jgi:hypothetical protein
MNTSDIADRIRHSVSGRATHLMNSMGYEPRRSTGEKVLMALGVFGAGLLVGAGLGVLFAPKAGTELRSDIGNGVGKVGQKARELTARVLPHGSESPTHTRASTLRGSLG